VGRLAVGWGRGGSEEGVGRLAVGGGGEEIWGG